MRRDAGRSIIKSMEFRSAASTVFVWLWLAVSTVPLQVGAESEFGAPTILSLSQDGMPGLHGTFAATALQPGEFAMGFGALGHTSVGLLTIRDATGGSLNPDDAFFLALRAHLAIGLGHGIDGSLSLPYYYETFSGPRLALVRARGHGDLSMSLKGVAPWSKPWFSAALLLRGTLPTASGDGTFPRALIHQPPAGSFPSPSTWPFGTVDPRFAAGAAGTFTFTGSPGGPILAHFNVLAEKPITPSNMASLGLIRSSAAVDLPLGDLFRAGLEAERQELVVEALDWSADVGEGFSIALGLAVHPAPWVAVRAQGRFGPEAVNPGIQVTRDGETWTWRANPPFQGGLSLALQGFPLRWDRDRDGFPDRKDRCPRRAEDKDGFEDHDGCPDIDNDRDGFTDTLDQCPMQAEDRDGFKDWDGCPDLDNDQDGVDDAKDACLNDAEDKDGVEDLDGCPEMDDDKDGIPDANDRCPKAAETRNGYEDSDGCPEPDGDRDGLPDRWDRCPTDAELVNFFQDEDGCPDAKPEPVRSGVLQGVVFLTGTAELSPVSYPSLDSLSRLLTIYPGTEIEVQGHVDDRAGSGSLELSHDRAKSVAAYLENKGIEARRIKPGGFGATRPIQPNRTAKGREANRRIEIRRLN